MLGQPNREFVIVGVKIGAVGGGPREEQDAWSGKRVWVDQQHTFTIVISKEEEIVVSKKLFHLFTKKVIAHEP
jgi:hypothetical protein